MKIRRIAAALPVLAAVLGTIILASLLAGAGGGLLPDGLLTGRKVNGDIFTVTNQILHPWGQQQLILGRPVDIALNADGSKVAVLNSNRVDIFDSLTGHLDGTASIGSTSYAGLAFRPGANELWASTCARGGRGGASGDTLAVIPVDATGHGGTVTRVPLTGRALPIGIAFTGDGAHAFVALSRNNTVAVLDAAAHKVLREIAVGMAPFGVAMDEKHGRVFVTNRGGRRANAGDVTAASGGSAIVTDATSGSTVSGTVSVIDLKNDSVREVKVGLSPALLATSPDGATVAVANAHGDSVSFIDAASLAVSEVKIPTWPASTMGSMPVSVSFSADGARLYVACAGSDALAMLTHEGKQWRLAGAFPTGWFPSAVVVDAHGTVHLTTIKGAADTDTKRGYKSTRYEGSLETIPQPTPAQAIAGQEEVRRLNEPKFEGPNVTGNLSSLGIQHVILIVKENRTYDQVLGDMTKGNGDKQFVEFGEDVTPNTHALADQFVLLDNFYTTGAISFDGHQWLMMAFVSDDTERVLGFSPRGYAWNMADALGVAPTGFFWQGAPKPLSLRIYGEFCVDPESDPAKGKIVEVNDNHLPGNWAENLKMWREGKIERKDSCGSGVPAMEKYIDRKFPSFIGLTDQAKTDEFLTEFAEYEKTGNLPQLSVVTLNNDHTQGTRPGTGTPRAMVADNDLAVGRLVERVSKSKYWEQTLILVTEDDAQNGIDHVDGHRTLCLAIGPHAKRGVVDSSNYNHLGMIRTIQEIFRVPSRTRFAQAARTMSGIFTKTADTRPFEHIEPKIDIAQMNAPVRGLVGPARKAAEQSLAMDFSDVDRADADTLNKIIWWSVKGFDTPYPKK